MSEDPETTAIKIDVLLRAWLLKDGTAHEAD